MELTPQTIIVIYHGVCPGPVGEITTLPYRCQSGENEELPFYSAPHSTRVEEYSLDSDHAECAVSLLVLPLGAA